MRGSTHLLAGAVAGLCVVSTNELPMIGSVTVIGLSLLGSLVPDLDINKSGISTVLKPLHILISLIISPFKWGVHRGITHSLFFALLIGYPVYLINSIYGISILLGILSHIFLDLISDGTQLLAPFSSIVIRLAKIKTGSIGEHAVALCLLLLSVGMIIKIR